MLLHVADLLGPFKWVRLALAGLVGTAGSTEGTQLSIQL